MDEDLIVEYINETFYNKRIQYEQALKEIEQKSFKSSRNDSRPTEGSRPSYSGSTVSRSNYFDPSMSEQSDSLLNDTKDLDVSQIENFYEKKR